jgi:LacI family gluconate utilization system Gnt-I transcriptional repressor
VRITDVAKLAGVAPITVSRVLNAPDSVAKETLRRVRDAIDRTGYVPNLLAGGLASSRSRLIRSRCADHRSPRCSRTRGGALTETFANAGYQVTFGQTGYGDAPKTRCSTPSSPGVRTASC